MKYQASAYMLLNIDLKVDDMLIGLIWSGQADGRYSGAFVLRSPQCLTLLSLSSSALSHSKSLYRLRTDDSFSLKMGRLVCGQKNTDRMQTFDWLPLFHFVLIYRETFSQLEEKEDNFKSITYSVFTCFFPATGMYAELKLVRLP